MYEINKDEETININGEIIQECLELDNGNFFIEIDYSETGNINLSHNDYPKNLEIIVRSDTGFETYLFYEFNISKSDEILKIIFECEEPNKFWEGKFGLSTFLAALKETIDLSDKANVEFLSIDDDWKTIEVSFIIDKDVNLKTQIDSFAGILKNFITETELNLQGAIWKKEFETNERRFCEDILYPLLRKMQFHDVKYRQGNKEYGKDFTFSEHTKFGNLRHFGLQAKAGNIRGNVNSDMDEIIGQLRDAISMPYHDISANESRRISTFIVAISGHFTENAQEKMIHKIPNMYKGSVYFFDRDKILELIEKYWK